MNRQKILVEPFLDGNALRVVLNAPKANVLDSVMMGEINDLLDELRGQESLKLLCFQGAGPHFSFGAAVEEHVGERARSMLGQFHGLFYRLADLAVPTAAVVTGRCLGGGMELATFCGRVFATPDAILAQPEIQLGVLPPVASVVFPLRAGQAAADDLILTGRNITGEEALRLHLVDDVSPDPRAAMEAWATRYFAPKSASSLRMAWRTSRWHLHRRLREDLPGIEALYLDELMATFDANEGLASFLEKRSPAWQHH